jgi:hypothetical protein
LILTYDLIAETKTTQYRKILNGGVSSELVGQPYLQPCYASIKGNSRDEVLMNHYHWCTNFKKAYFKEKIKEWLLLEFSKVHQSIAPHKHQCMLLLRQIIT